MELDSKRQVSLSERFLVLTRDNSTCILCGKSVHEDNVKIEVDHIFPHSRGGKTIFDNVACLCWDCNRGKSDKIYPEHIQETIYNIVKERNKKIPDIRKKIVGSLKIKKDKPEKKDITLEYLLDNLSNAGKTILLFFTIRSRTDYGPHSTFFTTEESTHSYEKIKEIMSCEGWDLHETIDEIFRCVIVDDGCHKKITSYASWSEENDDLTISFDVDIYDEIREYFKKVS